MAFNVLILLIILSTHRIYGQRFGEIFRTYKWYVKHGGFVALGTMVFP